MTAVQFCFWLQGFFELSDAAKASGEGTVMIGFLHSGQVAAIRSHLALVFAHEIDPSMGDAKQQAKLDAIHHGPTGGTGAVKMRC